MCPANSFMHRRRNALSLEYGFGLMIKHILLKSKIKSSVARDIEINECWKSKLEFEKRFRIR